MNIEKKVCIGNYSVICGLINSKFIKFIHMAIDIFLQATVAVIFYYCSCNIECGLKRMEKE